MLITTGIAAPCSAVIRAAPNDSIEIRWRRPSIPAEHANTTTLIEMLSDQGRWLPLATIDDDHLLLEATEIASKSPESVKIRVKTLVDRVGESEACYAVYDEMSSKRPREVSAQLRADDSVVMKWQPPLVTDNVDGYRVQVLAPDDQWLPVAVAEEASLVFPLAELVSKTSPRGQDARLRALDEPRLFQLRVVPIDTMQEASSKADAAASDICELHFVPPDAVRPYCKLKREPPFRLERGRTLSVEVEYVDDSPSSMKVQFSKDGAAICDSKRRKVFAADGEASLTVGRVDTEDMGEYAVRVESKRSGLAFELPFRVDVMAEPLPPCDLRLVECLPSAAVLSWAKEEAAVGDDAPYYVVKKRRSGRKVWQEVGETASPSFQIEGLIDDEQYDFAVVACNRVGRSQPSELAGVRIQCQWSPPSTTSRPVVTLLTACDATVEWCKPDDDGGSPILGYHVYVRSKGMQKWQRVLNAETSDK